MLKTEGTDVAALAFLTGVSVSKVAHKTATLGASGRSQVGRGLPESFGGGRAAGESLTPATTQIETGPLLKERVFPSI